MKLVFVLFLIVVVMLGIQEFKKTNPEIFPNFPAAEQVKELKGILDSAKPSSEAPQPTSATKDQPRPASGVASVKSSGNGFNNRITQFKNGFRIIEGR